MRFPRDRAPFDARVLAVLNRESGGPVTVRTSTLAHFLGIADARPLAPSLARLAERGWAEPISRGWRVTRAGRNFVGRAVREREATR